MILKGNQRGGHRQLANHMTSDENDHHRTVILSGFASDNLHEALQETHAISKATQCKKMFFTVVISPPEGVDINESQVLEVVRRIQKRFNIENQPHALVEHEKDGRRHWHLISSRIDTDRLIAIEHGLYKRELNGLSRDLFIEHGWQLPKGYSRHQQPDPRNFNLAEWQQAKRLGLHPKQLKGEIKRCWDTSDNHESFKAALTDIGCYLARGDRRGHVAVSWQGEIIALNKNNLGEIAKNIRAKIGAPDDAPAIATIKAKIAVENYGHHKRLRRELAMQQQTERLPLTLQKQQLITAHRKERAVLLDAHTQRRKQENTRRLNRLRKGWRGLWDLVTGKSKNTRLKNATEVEACIQRDAHELHVLKQDQLHARQTVQSQLNKLREKHQSQTMELNASFIKNSEQLVYQGELKQTFNRIVEHIKHHQQAPELKL